MARAGRINNIPVGGLVLPSGCVDNEALEMPAAGKEFDADKLQHIHAKGTNFALAIGGTPATREELVHICTTSGTIRTFWAVLNDTGTSTDCTFDIKKNGTTMLSSPVQITHATTDKIYVAGTISVSTFAAGDLLSIALTATSTTGAQGPFAQVTFEETAA